MGHDPAGRPEGRCRPDRVPAGHSGRGRRPLDHRALCLQRCSGRPHGDRRELGPGRRGRMGRRAGRPGSRPGPAARCHRDRVPAGRTGWSRRSHEGHLAAGPGRSGRPPGRPGRGPRQVDRPDATGRGPVDHPGSKGRGPAGRPDSTPRGRPDPPDWPGRSPGPLHEDRSPARRRPVVRSAGNRRSVLGPRASRRPVRGPGVLDPRLPAAQRRARRPGGPEDPGALRVPLPDGDWDHPPTQGPVVSGSGPPRGRTATGGSPCSPVRRCTATSSPESAALASTYPRIGPMMSMRADPRQAPFGG
jgi:hypothetical protein